VSAKSALRNGGIVAAGYGQRLLSTRRRLRQVAMLHDVESAEAFRRCLDWLAARYAIVPLRDLVAGDGDADRASLALTFDDGYADWHEIAAPVLEELRCPATFFVSSGYVGLPAHEARAFRRERLRRSRDLPPLTIAQLRDLSQCDLFEIGSHTVSHVNFADVTPDALSAEIDGDRAQLEEWTGEPVRWFAYPWGGQEQLVPVAVEHVRLAGFAAAFTALPGTLDHARDPFLLPRQSIDVLSRPSLWGARLSGGYDVMFATKRLLSPGGRPGRPPDH
jgi:peptidoglycan/xylan/chitin deacetylase (PgdA/CDA1 family)